jgi:hypothetical protein
MKNGRTGQSDEGAVVLLCEGDGAVAFWVAFDCIESTSLTRQGEEVNACLRTQTLAVDANEWVREWFTNSVHAGFGRLFSCNGEREL